jgi:pseudaminic acid cytidylyltransferase
MKKKRLAIIPAREGSKRIKNKNLKKFHKKPLIYYSIKSTLDSGIFDKIHISSDSQKILNYSERQGIKTDFVRPKKLSDNLTGLFQVIEYVADQYKRMGNVFDEIWLIYATNPFISKEIIKKCSRQYNKISNNKSNALITVTKYNYPTQWAHKIKNKGFLAPLDKKGIKLRSQDLLETYCDAGMINVYSYKKIINNFNNIKYYPYELPLYKSVDIDTLEDFKIAEKMFKF